MQTSTPRTLDIAKTLGLIQPGGRFSQYLQGFEARPEQQEMMRAVLDAYHDQAVALIEAGTGIGKSIAYLIPAILWAAKFGERTVISTHTITLQEQLIEKDIPLVIKALGLDVKATLVKGIGNYLCLRKFEEATTELLPPNEMEELKLLESWRATTRDGTRSELSFAPSAAIWERTCAEADTCTGHRCPLRSSCFFINARLNAKDAQILVVNHHLLFSDLARRAQEENYQEAAVLPPYQHLIIDEAHHLEEIATEHFASRVSEFEAIRLMSRLSAERHGRLTTLKTRLGDFIMKEKGPLPAVFRDIQSRLELELPSLRRDLVQQFADLFDALRTFVSGIKGRENEDTPGEVQIRLLPKVLKHPDWTLMQPAIAQLVTTARSYCAALDGLNKQLMEMGHRKFEEQTAGLRHDIRALTQRLEAITNTLETITLHPCGQSRVRWMETYTMRNLTNVQLIDAELEVSQLLVRDLFSQFQSIILCSATLTSNRNFHFLRSRLGLTDSFQLKEVREQLLDSPFDYKKQALLAIPTDVPEPTHPDFIKVATERIWEAVQASRGNALVLFTSYQMLKTCHSALQGRFAAKRYPLLRHGEENRKALLSKLRCDDHSVLFATYSFWEGIDISGDALRCVIIVKLPFQVPTQPLLEARAEALTAAGKNPFLELAIPLATVKFKQGFGRLIRNGFDRGCVVCLDTRIITRPYGGLFLGSLPDMARVMDTSDIVYQRMETFYRQTQYLVRESAEAGRK